MQKAVTAAQERPPVIVFTCGRTGSTLLTRMLNCLPRTIVWGEHGGLLKPLLLSYSKGSEVAVHPLVRQGAELLQPVIDRKAVVPGRRMSLEWLNWFTPADIDRLYQGAIRELFYPASVRVQFTRWGFKEIRYREFEYAMLRKLFPCMKAIILYRNPAAVCASQYKHFAKNRPDRFPAIIRNVAAFYRFAAMTAENPPERDVLFVSYEEIVRDFANTSRLLGAFLEEAFAPQLSEIEGEVQAFLRRKQPSASEDDPIGAFADWKARTDVPVPARSFEGIVESYDSLHAALRTAQAAVPAAAGKSR
jgi:hypothetical protein